MPEFGVRFGTNKQAVALAELAGGVALIAGAFGKDILTQIEVR